MAQAEYFVNHISPATMDIEPSRRIASAAPSSLATHASPAAIEEALRISGVEKKLFSLFNADQMHDTAHTAVRQKFGVLSAAGRKTEDDWVTSNDPYPGDFLSRLRNWRALMDQLLELGADVCSKNASSQRLYAHEFLSNSPQRASVPLATGATTLLSLALLITLNVALLAGHTP
jgi:hypothetical protein